MLDPDQFILLSLIPILDFDLVELSFALVGLWRWRWWWRVGIEVLITSASLGGASTSAILASAYRGGRHVDLL
jgi:hypothetical protein